MQTKKRRSSPPAQEPAPSLSLDQFPLEMRQFVERMAIEDAEQVGECLTSSGVPQRIGEGSVLPIAFLLNLAGALRLLKWELSGVQLHLEHGLPSAEAAMKQVTTQACEDPAAAAALPAQLHSVVYSLTLDHFSWAGPLHLDADVLLDVPDEDTLIEAFAQLLLTAATGASPLAGGSDS